MRKHHNKLFFGKYTHKATFVVPVINVCYPTSTYYLHKITTKFSKDAPVAKVAKFIMNNRANCKFRIQNNKIIFYAHKNLILELITDLWDYWCNISTVDITNLKLLDESTVVCKRLPLGKFEYQVHVNRNMVEKLTTDQRDQLYAYLARNTDNATITNQNLKQWLSGKGAIHYDLTGYFYVRNEKALLPIYMISENIIGKIRKFIKV